MKKIIKFVIAFFVIIIFILVIKKIVEYRYMPKTSVDNFATIKELVEFDGHEYIDMKDSQEADFKKDIYIKFNKPTINEDGTTNQKLYEILISHIAAKMKNQKFRILDEEKNLIIKVDSKEDGTASYTINNESNYWENIQSKYQIENVQDDKKSDLTIASSVLSNIINNNWIYNQVNLGSIESTIDNYEVYYDEGYKVKKIGSEIYNIIFTSNYDGEVLKNITTSSTTENIENILGKPTFKDENFNIIGYKSNYFYIFFSKDEISVYPIEKYNEEDSVNFGKIVSELNKTGDIETFVNKLTDIYPDYEKYYNEDNFINITYPLRGFEVSFGASSNNGITLYSNFIGHITENITMDDLKNGGQIPTNIFIELTKNSVLNAESMRLSDDEFYRNPYDELSFLKTNEYSITCENNKYLFYSTDKKNIDSEIIINDLTNMVNYNDYIFIYGVKNEGLFSYNAKNLEKKQIVKRTGEFKIEKIEENKIYYDNKVINYEEE